jgi:hypothetical protein
MTIPSRTMNLFLIFKQSHTGYLFKIQCTESFAYFIPSLTEMVASFKINADVSSHSPALPWIQTSSFLTFNSNGFTFQNQWFSVSIPLVSSFKTIGFQLQFHWFRVLIPLVFRFNSNGFKKWSWLDWKLKTLACGSKPTVLWHWSSRTLTLKQP